MQSRAVVGVDVGGTKMLGGVLDAELGVSARLSRAVPTGNGRGEGAVEALVELIEALRAASAEPVAAVGVGVPALLNRRGDVVRDAVHLPWRGLALADLLSERLGLPVFLDNDANAALLAEHRLGAARDAREAVMLTIGTGIGAGLLLEGRLYRGLGAAGELGHMVVDEDGPPCPGNCPNHGCLEAVASGTALAQEAQRVARQTPDCGLGRALREGRKVTGALVTELAHDGDRAARDVIALVGTRLGIGLANIVNIFNPELVVVGGGVMAAGELLLAPARQVLRQRALPALVEQVLVKRAALGAESGMVGAALLAREGVGAG